MRRDGGGTDINRDAIGRLDQARIDRDNVVAFTHCDRDFPLALAQRLLQTAQHGEIGHSRIDIPLRFQRLNQAGEIGGRAINIGLGHFDKIEPHDRFERNRPRLGLFAHNLAMHLAFRRHVDDDITAKLGLTAQAPMRAEFAALRGVALFNRVPLGQMAFRRLNAMFGKIAFCHQNLTAPANTAAAANTVDIDAKLAGCFKHRGAIGKIAALARWGKDDPVGISHASSGDLRGYGDHCLHLALQA